MGQFADPAGTRAGSLENESQAAVVDVLGCVARKVRVEVCAGDGPDVVACFEAWISNDLRNSRASARDWEVRKGAEANFEWEKGYYLGVGLGVALEVGVVDDGDRVTGLEDTDSEGVG